MNTSKDSLPSKQDIYLHAIIVIYNKKCIDSESLMSLERLKPSCKIYIYDNSDRDYGNHDYCLKHGYNYYSLGKNIGLSKAYNKVLEGLEGNNNSYVIILDDDTPLTKEYLNEVTSNIYLNKYDVLLPIIESNNRILSPSNLVHGCRSKVVSTIQDIVPQKITAINSGMVIRLNFLKKNCYNEKLFLDYVDHDFMKRVHEHGGKIQIMNCVIHQNYSKNIVTTVDSAIYRFKICLADYKTFCTESKHTFSYRLGAIKMAFDLSKKYHTLIFFKLLECVLLVLYTRIHILRYCFGTYR